MTDKDIKICGHGSGKPSIKNLHDYAEQRYKQKAPNGKRKGIVCVRRHKKMTDKLGEDFVKTYKTIIGRNIYNQNRRGYVYTKYSNGNYYSDCSSSGMATMRKIGLSIGSWLLNTAGIYESELFEDVPVIIKDGHITNPEVLKLGDAILFAGSDPNRPKQIGHVEYVYFIPENKVEDKNEAMAEAADDKTDDKMHYVNYIGQITASSLYIRNKASKDSQILGDFDKGDYVWVTIEKDGWGYANGRGWISLKYVKKQTISVKGKVTASALNVRNAAVKGDIVKVIPKNTEVAISRMNADGTWGYDERSRGWVSLKYIDLN